MAKKNSKKILTNGYISIKESKHGVMMYNRHDRYVGRSFDMYGQFSDDEFEILRPWATGGFVLDIGANIGALTVPFAKVARAVIAAEPQPWVADILTANIALNNLRNVDVLRACIGQENGTAQMPVSDPNVIGNYGGVGLYGTPGDTKQERTVTVPIFALDSIGIGKVDVIKMDVEGHEEPALRGAENLIRTHHPVMYIEADRFDKVPSLFAYIKSLGYEILMHKPFLFERKNYFDESENVFNNIASINAFCYIPEKHTEVNKEYKIKFRMEPCL